MAGETLPDVNSELLDAISHGIDNEGALPDGSNQLEDDPDAESPADTTEDPDESGGDDSEGDAGEQPGDESAAAIADDAARPRNADGTYKSKEQIAAEAAAKPDDKAAQKPVDPKAAKQPADAINDPIPKDLKQATQERIRTLIDTTKQATERATTIERDFSQIVEGIKSTGTSPEQYGEMLSFMGMFNSQDPQQQSKALELANDFVVRLSTMLGVNVPSHDPMERHQDLQQAVQTGKITREYAAEIARTRNQTGFRGEISAQQQQQQAAQQEQERVTQWARSSLDNLQANLRQQDPNYEAKKAQLVPMLQPIFANLHPSKWPEAFHAAYQKLAFTPVASVPAGNKIPKNQPMRAGKGSGGGAGGNGMNKEANSALDALNEALAGR